MNLIAGSQTRANKMASSSEAQPFIIRLFPAKGRLYNLEYVSGGYRLHEIGEGWIVDSQRITKVGTKVEWYKIVDGHQSSNLMAFLERDRVLHSMPTTELPVKTGLWFISN